MSSCVRATTPDCIRGVFCSRAPTPDCFQAPTLECIRAPMPDCVHAPTPECIRAPTPDYIRGIIDHLGSKRSEGVLAELNVGNARYGASHWRPSFMPDSFRGGAPPWPWADFYEFNSELCNVISDEMYSQYMYISNPLSVENPRCT